MEYKIYLSGAITGLAFMEANGWRKDIETAVAQYVDSNKKITFFNPVTKFASCLEERFPFRRDISELKRSDLMILNISQNPGSIGSNIEVGIAYENNIPIILYNPDKKKIHPWHLEIADAVITDIRELVYFLKDYYL